MLDRLITTEDRRPSAWRVSYATSECLNREIHSIFLQELGEHNALLYGAFMLILTPVFSSEKCMLYMQQNSQATEMYDSSEGIVEFLTF